MQKEINERMIKRANHIVDTHVEMATDFMVNVIAKLKEYECRQFTNNALSEMHMILNEWNEKWLSDDRESGFEPAFSIVADEEKRKISIVPANMSAHVFMMSINALAAIQKNEKDNNGQD